MPKVVRVALPGYDALHDTNPDHFSLYTHEPNSAEPDWVLIKEFTRGGTTITGNGSQVIATIPHNLGYIPFFLVYVFDTQSLRNPNKWKLLAHNTAGASAPPYLAVADTTNLYIYNFLTALAGAIQFKYYIFYDDVSSSGNPTIVESKSVIKVAKRGVNVLQTKNPNDFIFHSDLNTLKIIKEGNATINYTVDGVYTFAHGANIANPAAFLVFVKFPDGKTGVMPGVGVLFAFNNLFNITDTYIDTTNIGMYIAGTGGANTLHAKYYVFETPLT